MNMEREALKPCLGNSPSCSITAAGYNEEELIPGLFGPQGKYILFSKSQVMLSQGVSFMLSALNLDS
jgi:hypothetical protein